MAGKKSLQKKDIPMIRTVTPLNRHQLHIEFGSGSILELNMANRLGTNRYYDLNHDSVFRSAVTDGAKIIFDIKPQYELNIFPREALNMALKAPGENLHIQSVLPLEKARLRLEMKSDSILTLNMENWLPAVRYHPLQVPETFRSVSTDGENLFFGPILKIDPEELIHLALKIPPVIKKEP